MNDPFDLIKGITCMIQYGMVWCQEVCVCVCVENESVSSVRSVVCENVSWVGLWFVF